MKLAMRVFWNHGPIPLRTRSTAKQTMVVPFGTILNLGSPVHSVNGKTGIVVLDASDVGADPAGTAANLFNDPTDFVGLIDTTWEL